MSTRQWSRCPSMAKGSLGGPTTTSNTETPIPHPWGTHSTVGTNFFAVIYTLNFMFDESCWLISTLGLQILWSLYFGPYLLTSWTPRTLLTTASSIKTSWCGWGRRPCQISGSSMRESMTLLMRRVCQPEATCWKFNTVSFYTRYRLWLDLKGLRSTGRYVCLARVLRN